jgi:malonate-semialdehyde dehydrogenase (acetylating)/methylmalonate-semialdehyde dehydrogenase
MLDRGPLISAAAKERVIKLITSAEHEGGKIRLDGRAVQVTAYPNGNFVGPTIIEADTSMQVYKYAGMSPFIGIG